MITNKTTGLSAVFPHLGGYDLTLFEEGQHTEKYKCTICHKVLKKSLQLLNGPVPKRACYMCYTENIRDGFCPVFKTQDINYFADVAADREIGKLRVECVNKENGCPWKDHLHQYEDHIKFCRVTTRYCDCGEPFSLSDSSSKLMEHLLHQKKCLFSYIGCEGGDSHTQRKHEAIIVSAFIELQQSNNLLKQKLESMHQELLETEKKYLRLRRKRKMEKESENMKLDNQTYIQNTSGLTSTNRIPLKSPFQESKTLMGSAIWKIDDVNSRMKQAKNDKCRVLKSPPSYTAPFEYRYCTLMYLNGKGMGLDTHISVAFALMKSDYDHLLKWPVEKKVTFKLINQDNPAASLTSSVTCTFEKPLNDINVLAGLSRFISINNFISGQFIKSDCICIETNVVNI